MTAVDTRLYALIDPAQAGGHDIAALARAVAEGGATLVQLRDKLGSTREMIARALRLKQALAGAGVPLLINDRVDVALAAEADGVHVGQDDMPAETARALLGPEAIVGLSVGSEAEAAAAPVGLVDYVCIGAIFATGSKGDAGAAIGLDGFARLAAMLRRSRAGMNICAIAGIDASNAADIIAAGADGVAVISALAGANHPHAAAKKLRGIVDAARAERSVA